MRKTATPYCPLSYAVAYPYRYPRVLPPRLQYLRLLHNTDTIDLDNILVDMHLTPSALEIRPPRFVKEERVEKIEKQHQLLVRPSCAPAVLEETLFTKRHALLVVDLIRTPMRSHSPLSIAHPELTTAPVSRVASSPPHTFLAVQIALQQQHNVAPEPDEELLPPPPMTIEQAVMIIQMSERGKQARFPTYPTPTPPPTPFLSLPTHLVAPFL